jgi:hypothetical protein
MANWTSDVDGRPPGGKVGGSGRGWQPTGIGGADNGQTRSQHERRAGANGEHQSKGACLHARKRLARGWRRTHPFTCRRSRRMNGNIMPGSGLCRMTVRASTASSCSTRRTPWPMPLAGKDRAAKSRDRSRVSLACACRTSCPVRGCSMPRQPARPTSTTSPMRRVLACGDLRPPLPIVRLSWPDARSRP